MKFIELSRGQKTMVDDEDFEYLSQWKWCARKGRYTFYAVRQARVYEPGPPTIGMHRVLMNITDRKIQVDHIDGDGLNNCKSNLRSCTNQQNMCNRRAKANKSSKYLGVSRPKKSKRYVVSISVNKRPIRIGSFKDEIAAEKAYNKAAKKYHKEFARLNIV